MTHALEPAGMLGVEAWRGKSPRWNWEWVSQWLASREQVKAAGKQRFKALEPEVGRGSERRILSRMGWSLWEEVSDCNFSAS